MYDSRHFCQSVIGLHKTTRFKISKKMDIFTTLDRLLSSNWGFHDPDETPSLSRLPLYPPVDLRGKSRKIASYHLISLFHWMAAPPARLVKKLGNCIYVRTQRSDSLSHVKEKCIESMRWDAT